MSSPSSETETYEITLSRDEQWVVHAVLADGIDDAIGDDESPPAWIVDLLEAIETGDGTEVLTGSQARRLSEAMTAYLDREDTPDQDYVHGSNVLDRLAERLETRDPPQ